MKISLVGAGNVGYHLGKKLYDAGHTILSVFSRNLENASSVADYCHAQAITKLAKLNTDVDLIIISVPDDKIGEVAAIIPPSNALVVHTSGTASITRLAVHSRYGLFYPLQTFSKQQNVNFEEIPFLVDANTPEDKEILKILATTLTDKVFFYTEEQRSLIHLGAVIVNNFTNHLFAQAHHLLEGNKIDFDILKPLIAETLRKINTHSPSQVQTGPASRADYETMKKHLDLLEDNPSLEEIYRLISKSIMENR